MAVTSFEFASPPEEDAGRSLTIRAYSKLRAQIISGALAPGQRLKVETLRDLLEVGATPIREALSLLTSDGLVERLDKRGFRVSEVSLAVLTRSPRRQSSSSSSSLQTLALLHRRRLLARLSARAA